MIPKTSQAIGIIDIYHSIQSWGLRWQGYRSYRVPLVLKNGETCQIALTAHVNPKVTQFTLLLHGFGDSRYSWGKWLDLYEDHAQKTAFIAIDWPQHGDTDCPIKDPHEIADLIPQALHKFGRPIERVIGNSLGVLTAALLNKHYPEAQQVWLVPPFLETSQLNKILNVVLEIDTPEKVQGFLNLVLTKPQNPPRFILNAMLRRIQKSQEVLKTISINEFQNYVFNQKYNNLQIVVSENDALLPPRFLDSRIQTLTSRPIQSVKCGHDLLRHCGEEVKIFVEQSRYNLQKATY